MFYLLVFQTLDRYSLQTSRMLPSRSLYTFYSTQSPTPLGTNVDSKGFYESTHGSILFKRTKEDVNRVYEEGRRIFTDATFHAILVKVSDEEKMFTRELVEFLRRKLRELASLKSGSKEGTSERVIPLLAVVVLKRATSSPYAAWKTFERLLLRRAPARSLGRLEVSVRSFLGTGYEDYEFEEDPDEILDEFLEMTSPLLTDEDRRTVKRLAEISRTVIEKGDSKLDALVSLLESVLENSRDTKVIVFTEYRDTLKYLVEKLKKRRPEWSRSIVSLSSAEVRDRETFERIREAFERDPGVRILAATDVAAEGLNLQVASVVVNYEVPWSLVKLEQRIGRVWRLGQKRDVEAYTLFTDNVVDRAALDSLYRKLLSLKEAELGPRPVIGREVLRYSADARDVEKPSSAALTKGKKFRRVTEAGLIRAYLERDEAGLRELANAILRAREVIEKELSSKSVLYKPRSRRDVEAALGLLGFRDHEEIVESLKRLLKALAPLRNLKYEEDEEGVRVKREKEMAVRVSTLDGFYAYLTGEEGIGGPVCLTALGDEDAVVTLVPVSVRDGRDGSLLYTDVVGYDERSGRVLRGASLLDAVSRALSGLLGAGELAGVLVSEQARAAIVDEVKRSLSDALSILEHYRERLAKRGLRDSRDDWLEVPEHAEVEVSSPIGCLRFTTAEPSVVPEEVKRNAEERAIEVVMEVERKEGRVPERVDRWAHCDIVSRDPRTGEILRFIEVKGHWGPSVYAELTEREVGLAKKEGDRYWLYVVYDIGSGQPKLFRCRDPLKTLRVEVAERARVERRYILRPQ